MWDSMVYSKKRIAFDPQGPNLMLNSTLKFICKLVKYLNQFGEFYALKRLKM